MREVRIHGRGGQGAVTTAQLLAIAAFYENKKSQAFPKFGVERRGAPVESYVRIDDKPILIRSQVYNPDVVIVLDASLLHAVDVTEGLKDNGILIINTKVKASDIKVAGKIKVFTVDASRIAFDVFQKPIVNTAMLGAYAAVADDVKVYSIHKAIEQEFSGELAEKNKVIVSRVFEETKNG